MTWSVIIPSARAENLVPAVRSVLTCHPDLDSSRIVVVDDGARARAEKQLPRGITWVDGKRPFVYSRNVNLGVQASTPNDSIIMGDDVELLTPLGFDRLSQQAATRPELGCLSATIIGVAGSPRQLPSPHNPFRVEEDWLAFICLLIPRREWDEVGPLDEQFTGYGCDDVDYCWRVRQAGKMIGVTSECVVRHDGTLPSTFRTRPDIFKMSEANRDVFLRKWKRLPGEKW